MSFWDSVGNTVGKGLSRVGLAEAEAPEDRVTTPATPNGVAQGSTAPVSQTSFPVATNIDPQRQQELDQKARTILITAMQNDGAPLVEELSDSLETLAEVVPDEGARFKTALKILVKQQHSVVEVLSDFDKCLGVLDESKREFEANMQRALETQVGSKIRSVEALNAEIATLQQQLNEKTSRRDQEQAGISIEQTKITQAQSRFTVVYSAIRHDVESKRSKIAQYGEGL